MDFRLTREDTAFQAAVTEFLTEAAPTGWRDRFAGDPEGLWRFEREFQRQLAAKGWLALSWPRELGGCGAGEIQQLILAETLAYHGAPAFVNMGVAWVGPAIMRYGDEEQQRTFLPRIAQGEDIWCTLYSEPNAGSDLAAIETRAVSDGDGFVIDGRKVWTTYAHRSDYGWLAVRTDPSAPKHRGISTFVVPMYAPGVTVRPLVNMGDDHEFNEVLFENVRIPRRNLVGELNRGWYQIAAGLDVERAAIGSPAAARRLLEQLAAGRRTAAPKEARPAHTASSGKLADIAIAAEVARLLSTRLASLRATGSTPGYEASAAKLFATELNQRLANTAVGVLGLEGQLDAAERRARTEGAFEHLYLRAVANTIEGGTSEVQRNVIATRGLGLPR